MTHKPDITVVVCTYNRHISLKEVLEDLLGQNTNGSFEYELIVVDNNSNDATKVTVASLIEKNPTRIKYVFEPRQGKSFAINTGIKLANGEIIVTTDDDCRINSDYLNKIYKNFQNYPKDVVLMGGKISAKWLNGKYTGWLDPIFAQNPRKERRIH